VTFRRGRVAAGAPNDDGAVTKVAARPPTFMAWGRTGRPVASEAVRLPPEIAGVPQALAAQTDWVRRVAARLVVDRDEAEDLAQDVLIAALQGRPPSALRPWLRGVLRNRWKMDARAHARRRLREHLAAAADTSPSAETLFEAREGERLVREALNALPEPYRTTIWRNVCEGLRAVDIARLDGVPPTTVRSRIAVGLERMRAYLDREAGGDRSSWRRALLILGIGRRPPRPWAWATTTLVVAAVLVAPPPRPRVSVPTAAPVLAGAAQVAGPGEVHAASGPRAAPESHRSVKAGRAPLILDPPRLSRLRAAKSGAGPLHDRLVQLEHRVRRADPALFGTDRLNYARVHRAQAAAALYAVTGEPRLAAEAFLELERVLEDPGEEPRPDASEHPHGRAVVGTALALAYDWAHDGFTPGQRERLEDQLRRAAEAWRRFEHPKLAPDVDTYLVAVARGAELLQRLALREPCATGRVADLIADLARHLAEGYGTVGLPQGGPADAARAAAVLLPAAYATASLGDHRLLEAVRRAQLWQLPLYTLAAGPDGPPRVLPHGVSSSRGPDAGWLALLSPLVPPEARRAFEALQEAALSGTEAVRGPASLWALVLSTDDGAPAARLPRAIGDPDRGAYFFRSGWTGHDVLVSLGGDFRSRPGGWDAPDALRLAVLAHGTLFAGSPGRDSDFRAARLRDGAGARHQATAFPEARLASGLLVDGREFARRGATGAPHSWTASQSGGYAIVDGGSKYVELGVTSVQRHLLVDFDSAEAGTLISTLDRVRAPAAHAYTFQLSPGDATGDDGVRSSAGGADKSAPAFVLRAGTQFLAGWAFADKDVRVEADDGVRLHVHGADADLWVVMLVGEGAPPQAVVDGAGLGARVRLGAVTVTWDERAGRLRVARAGRL
jgi:RNA polymerase sigma-70 factor (ECF subfamily)